MLDHRAFHQEADAVLERLTSRGVAADIIDQLKTFVAQRSEAIGHLEALRHKLNEATGEVNKRRRPGIWMQSPPPSRPQRTQGANQRGRRDHQPSSRADDISALNGIIPMNLCQWVQTKASTALNGK